MPRDAKTHERLELANVLLAAIRRDADPTVAVHIDAATSAVVRGIYAATDTPLDARGMDDGLPDPRAACRERRRTAAAWTGRQVRGAGRHWKVAAGSIALGVAAAFGSHVVILDGTSRRGQQARPPATSPNKQKAPGSGVRLPPAEAMAYGFVMPDAKERAAVTEAPVSGRGGVEPAPGTPPRRAPAEAPEDSPPGRTQRQPSIVRIPGELEALGIVSLRVAADVPSLV